MPDIMPVNTLATTSTFTGRPSGPFFTSSAHDCISTTSGLRAGALVAPALDQPRVPAVVYQPSHARGCARCTGRKLDAIMMRCATGGLHRGGGINSPGRIEDCVGIVTC